MKTYRDLSVEQFEKVLKKCSGKRVAIDTETTGLQWWSDTLTTVAFHCPDADIEGCIDFRDNPELVRVIRKIVNTALGPGTTTVFHNTKFDASFLGVDPECDFNGWNIVDTAVMIHLVDSRWSKKLEDAERILLGANTKREHISVAPARKKVWDWPADVRIDYCINDCRVTYQLATVLAEPLRELDLVDLFRKDMDYLKLLYKVEHRGILVDRGFVDRAAPTLGDHTTELEKQLFDHVGHPFNWRSPQQLATAIYDDINYPRPINPFVDADGVDRTRFRDHGHYNKTLTSTFILMEKAHHPLGELISALRESYKLEGTLRKLASLLDDRDVVHTNFNLTGTLTGRLSSSKPNLQNVPSDVRTRFTQGVFTGGTTRNDEYNLRNSFIARPGYSFLSIDYKQMEIRAFAILAKDPSMLEIVRRGADVHRDVAEAVWHVRDDVHREWAKTISFGMLYGMSAGSLMFRLDMTKDQANKVVRDYWTAFPRTKPWMKEIIDECTANGFVRYWSNRIWREEDPNEMFRGVNAAIQGGCADLLSIAALRADEWLRAQGKGFGGIVSFIHDELLMEVPKEEVERTAHAVGRLMWLDDLLDVPFLTDAKTGQTYGALEKMPIKIVEEDMPKKPYGKPKKTVKKVCK